MYEYVYKQVVRGIVLFVMASMATCIHAYVHYDEVQDRGVLSSLEGMRTFQVQYTNWVFYTINVGTPGFIETGVYNTRRKREDGYEIDYMPFLRFRAGPVVETSKELDFYLDANSRGFFVVQLPNTLGFTRDGRFMLDSKRRLVTLSGLYPVLGEEGEIFLPEGNDILVSRSGMIFVDGQPVTRMKISVFSSFKEMQALESLNGSFFVLTKDIGVLEGPEHYAVVQGSLEQNNVLKAITGDMLVAKNGYDAAAKTAHLINKALNTAASISSP